MNNSKIHGVIFYWLSLIGNLQNMWPFAVRFIIVSQLSSNDNILWKSVLKFSVSKNISSFLWKIAIKSIFLSEKWPALKGCSVQSNRPKHAQNYIRIFHSNPVFRNFATDDPMKKWTHLIHPQNVSFCPVCKAVHGWRWIFRWLYATSMMFWWTHKYF